MSSAPTVTVLTAVRNGARYLASTIDSVRAQTFHDWEYIVVDDASDDDTPRVIQDAARADDRIRYVGRTTAGGPYVAANHGLEVARGRYVMRIDGDDLATPERMATQLRFLEGSPHLRACLGAWRFIDASGSMTGDVRRVHTASPRVLRWSLCVVSGVVHSSALIERSALEEVGRYAPYPTSADLKLWCDLSRRQWLGVTHDVVTLYRQHESQITARRMDVQHTYAQSILRDHLKALTDECWDMDDVAALFAAGRWGRTGFRRGMSVLDRWERAWRADPILSADDRRELRRLTTRVRLRHARINCRSIADAMRGVVALVPGRSAK